MLLERARKVFGGGPQELPPAEPFQVACACGERVGGFRADHRQLVTCPGCGQTILVLPLSPYPKPGPLGAPVARLPAVLPEVRPTRPLGVRLRIRSRRARRRVKKVLCALVPPRRWFSPVRLLTLSIVLIIAGTAALTFHLNRRVSASGEIRRAEDAWAAAEKEGKFADARRELERIAARLPRSQKRAEIEQWAREAALFADLAMTLSPQDWLTQRQSGAGPAILLDAYVGPATTSDAASDGYQIESNVLVGNAFGRIDTSGFKLFVSLAPKKPTRLLFAARVESVHMVPGTSDECIIHLTPESGVLLTSALCLEQVGWPLDESSRALLESQKAWLLEQP